MVAGRLQEYRGRFESIRVVTGLGIFLPAALPVSGTVATGEIGGLTVVTGPDHSKLRHRFPRTQKAVRQAVRVVDAALLTDNSRSKHQVFTVCVVKSAGASLFDIRERGNVDARIAEWLSIVCPEE